jgi:hypothetical protein
MSLQTVYNEVFNIKGGRQIAGAGQTIRPVKNPPFQGVFKGELFTGRCNHNATIGDVALHGREIVGFNFHGLPPYIDIMKTSMTYNHAPINSAAMISRILFMV